MPCTGRAGDGAVNRAAAHQPRGTQYNLVARRQLGTHLVVVLVVPILGVRVTNRDVGQPLNLSASNPAGNDHTAGEPVVGVEELAVLLVRDEHVHSGIHGV